MLQVVGKRVFEVDTSNVSIESATLSVTMDGGVIWQRDVAGWCPVCYGANGDDFYIWTARNVTVFLADGRPPLEINIDDDDIRFVFRHGDYWIVVCEITVRLMFGDREIDRINPPDVVTSCHWVGDELNVTIWGGLLMTAKVTGDHFETTFTTHRPE